MSWPRRRRWASRAKPVLIGPLQPGPAGQGPWRRASDPLGATLDGIVAVYGEVIERLAAQGAEWIQLDEPCLVQDRTPEELAALTRAYAALAARKGNAKLWVQHLLRPRWRIVRSAGRPAGATRSGSIWCAAPTTWTCCRSTACPPIRSWSPAIVDGRNVWRCDLEEALLGLELLRQTVPAERLIVSSSCSLQLVPYDAAPRDGFGRRAARLAGLRRAEAGRAIHPDPRPERGARGDRRRARR